MAITLTVRDESATGGITRELAVKMLTERVTARELIRSRVYQEVQDYNLKQTGPFRGLVQPEEAERTRNGPRPGKPRPIDWKKQYESARLKQMIAGAQGKDQGKQGGAATRTPYYASW